MAKRRCLVERFWERVKKDPHPDGCWLWVNPNVSEGYGYLWDVKKPLKAHRVSAWLHGIIPDLASPELVLHRCDVRACVNPEHLFTGDAGANSRDMCSKGRHAPAKGACNPNVKLTEHQVLAVRSRYTAGGVSQQKLADEYGVAQSTISSIVRREKWTHLA